MPLPVPPVENPSFVSPGLRFVTIQQTVDLGTAAASFSLTDTIPANANVVSVALSVPSTITAATAVKIGVGRVTSTADPDKYYLTSALTAGEFAKTFGGWGTPLTAAETVGIFACDTDGAAAGTIGAAGQYVVVRIVYALPDTIY